MPNYVFNGEELCDEMVAGISETLDEAGVPSILWSEYAMTLYGVPTCCFGANFVLPDDKISTGYEALRTVGFLECSQFSDCAVNMRYTRGWQPLPTQHLHMSEDDVVSLFKKSETLWDLSSFEVDPSNGELMFASERLIPHSLSGNARFKAFASHLYPVRIPKPAYYTEAVIKLVIRHGRRFAWDTVLGYMTQYVVGSHILEIKRDFKPEFRPLLRILKGERPRENYMERRAAALEELDAILKKRSETVQEQSEQNSSTAT